MSQVVAIIPARAGSKGVIDKNIKELAGYPLIRWSIEACKKSKSIDRIIVSTDSEAYRDLCLSYGAEVPFLRPIEISGDNSTDIDFIIHALDWMNENQLEPSLIAHIRPTTPLRNPKLIDQAITSFDPNKNTSLRSVHQMAESAYKNFEISDAGNLVSIFTRQSELDSSNNVRQSFADTYTPNGYIDVLSTDFIRANGLMHGNNVMPFITETVTEIDNEYDFEFLEYQVASQPAIISKLFNQY